MGSTVASQQEISGFVPVCSSCVCVGFLQGLWFPPINWFMNYREKIGGSELTIFMNMNGSGWLSLRPVIDYLSRM